METVMPCASNDVVLNNHLIVGFREGESTDPTEVLLHLWLFAHVLDNLEDPIAIDSHLVRVLHPDTVLCEISHSIVLKGNHGGLSNDDTWSLSLVNNRVGNGAALAHDGIFKLDS